MLKRASAGLVPALFVSIVLAASFFAPAAGPFRLFGATLVACTYTSPTPTVTGVSPSQGLPAGGTIVSVTGSGFCNSVSSVHFGATAATSFTVLSDTLLQATSPVHIAGLVDVTVTNAAGTSATSSADQYTYTTMPALSACRTTQYTLTGNNGSTWMNMDAANLTISFTPTVNSFAVLNGNSDLWTSTAGFNQDLGLGVSGGTFPSTAGQPEAWKESGGSGGTFSPNAADVETVVSVLASTTYTVNLQWKANVSDSGSIWAGAGPIAGKFSETCLSYRLIPVSAATVVAKARTAQYTLPASNGSTWQDIDTTNLSLNYTAPAAGFLVLAGNADLWTANAGFNQDLAINLDGSVAAWKESGGFAGTFSPNAAYVLDVTPVASGTAHTAKLQWKTNKADPSGTIYAGAGPIGGKFSATSLSMIFLPTGNGTAPVDKVSTTQYSLTNSDGNTWQPIDSFKFTLNYTPTSDCQVFLSANADLWSANAGFNQDIGISIVDTTYPTVAGQPEGWKESGGFNGAFSPNAAFAQIVPNLIGGHSYTAQLVWKANKADSGTIYAGAGPIGGQFSPTRLTLQPIGC